MKNISRTLTVKGHYGEYEANVVTADDFKNTMMLYSYHKNTTEICRQNGFRAPNLTEALTETAFMLATGAIKLITFPKNISQSCDCYNTTTDELIEVKSSWNVDDLTSFSPKVNSDVVYFQDFSAHNGEFKVYRIEYNWILSAKVNKLQTFADQQVQGRRPRLSIQKQIIRPRNLVPVFKGYIFQKDRLFINANLNSGMLAKAKAKSIKKKSLIKKKTLL